MDPKFNQSEVIAFIGHRVSEMNTWINDRNIIWVLLLLAAFWQASEAIKANNRWRWVLVGCICITWVCFEASCAYYLHVNGAQNSRLEKMLTQPEIGHEYGRTLENKVARAAAPVGFIVPYFGLFILACTMLCLRPKGEYGVCWMLVLICCMAAVGYYYWWLQETAKAVK